MARRSSTGSTIPRPIRSAQTRLTMTRAKYGFSGAVIQRGQRLARVGVGIVAHRGRCRTAAGAPGPSPVSGCLTDPDFAVKMISSLPEIGGDSPVPLRPTRAK